MSFPLHTHRLSIEPLGPSDLKDFVSYRQHPEIARYQSWDTSYSESQAQSLVESQAGVTLPAPGEWLQLAVHLRSTKVLVGDVAIHLLEETPRVFEIGFTVAKQHQQHGYAKEAVSRVLEFLFSDAAASKLIANTDQRNLASINLLKSLGFQHLEAKSWSEEFKGEVVIVECFEKQNPLAN